MLLLMTILSFMFLLITISSYSHNLYFLGHRILSAYLSQINFRILQFFINNNSLLFDLLLFSGFTHPIL